MPLDLFPTPQDDAWLSEPLAVLNADETSQVTGLSKFTLLRMRQRPDCGGLPYVRLSEKRIGYLRCDVKTFLLARRVTVAGERAEAA